MNEPDLIYSLTVEDVQRVAREVLGRRLSNRELTAVADPIAERINWFDAIAAVIEEHVE